jgi:hypothetical protein
MDARPFNVITRVKHSRDEIERATQVGLDKKREGYSPEALVLAIDEILQDLQLSRAIVVYVQSAIDEKGEPAVERPFSWFTMLSAISAGGLCLWFVYELFRLVRPNTNIFEVILIVITQSILLKIFRSCSRLAFMSAGDGLNDVSYPTKLHPLKRATSIISTLRLRRLRALVTETADRISAGEEPSKLVAELSEVNLTDRAAHYLVGIARINAAARGYLPPYEPRWLAISLAVVFMVTCIVVVERAGDRIVEGYRNYAIGVSGWIAGDIAARPGKRPRRDAES